MIRWLVLTLLTMAIYYLVDSQVRRWRQRFGDRLRQHMAGDSTTAQSSVVRTGGSLIACDQCGLFVSEASAVRSTGGGGRYCSEACARRSTEG